MESKFSVLMAVVGLSMASAVAHSQATVSATLDIEDQGTMMASIKGNVSWDIEALTVFPGGVSVSDPMTGGTFSTGTVTMNTNSTETVTLVDPMGETLQFTTNQVVMPVNEFVGINTIEFGATGGPMSECNVTPGVACTTTSLQVKAPEIDAASAMSGLTLLAGACIVLRGRRRALTPC